MLRDFFSPEKAARGFDLGLAVKSSKTGWVLGGSVGYALMPFYPPTARIGMAGWGVIGALSVATGIWMYILMRRPERITRDTLLLTAYLGLAYIVAAQWLAGGLPAPYHELYPFMICTAAAVHTPARFLGFLGVLAVLAVVPEVGHASAAMIGDLVAELGLWVLASLFILGVMWQIRQHRADSQENEARAHELARVDELTGLGNRRAFAEAMATEIARSRRNEEPLGLLLCDLDSFKKINDVHGHLAGDNCLRQVADALRNELRGADVCFRWGGDEFVVVLAGTPEPAVLEVAARIESHVSNSCARPDGTPLTVTTGHAALLDWMSGPDLVAAADKALLERKRRPSPQPAS
ncbi:MAG TPA: GGDEF domain-containing protein [Thermoleophilaceae bacterium]